MWISRGGVSRIASSSTSLFCYDWLPTFPPSGLPRAQNRPSEVHMAELSPTDAVDAPYYQGRDVARSPFWPNQRGGRSPRAPCLVSNGSPTFCLKLPPRCSQTPKIRRRYRGRMGASRSSGVRSVGTLAPLGHCGPISWGCDCGLYGFLGPLAVTPYRDISEPHRQRGVTAERLARADFPPPSRCVGAFLAACAHSSYVGSRVGGRTPNQAAYQLYRHARNWGSRNSERPHEGPGSRRVADYRSA